MPSPITTRFRSSASTAPKRIRCRPSSRIAGKAFLKSGTTVAGDGMNQRALIMTRGLAGYMKGKSGRDLVVAIYVDDVPLGDDMVPQLLKVIEDQGVILEYVYDRT